MSRYTPLDRPAGDFPRVGAHGGNRADEPFISETGGLLPMTLCGRTSLSSLRHLSICPKGADARQGGMFAIAPCAST